MNAFARELRSAVSKAGSYPVSALGDVLNKSPEALSEWEQLRSNLRPPPKLKKYVLSQVARWGLTLSSDGKLLTLSAPRTPTPGSVPSLLAPSMLSSTPKSATSSPLPSSSLANPSLSPSTHTHAHTAPARGKPPGSQATSMASAGGGHHAGSGTSAAQGGAKIRPGQGSGSGAGSAPGGVALSGTTVADWVCTALGLAPPAVVPLHLSPLVGHFRLFACTQCLSQSSRLIPRDANSPMDTLCGSCGAPGSETMMFAARAAPNTPPSMLRWRRVTRRPSVASAAPDRFIFCAAAGSQGHDPGAVSEPMGALSGCSCPHSAAEAAEWNWDRPTAVELRDAWYIVNAGSSSVPVCAYCLTHHGLAIVLPEDYAPDLLVCPRSRSVAPSGATIDPHPWQPVKGPPRHDPPPSLYPQAVGSAPAGEAALLLGLPAAARAPPAHAATRIAPSDINAFLKWLHRQPVDPATSLIGLDSDSYRTLLHNVLLCDELALHDPRPVTAEYDPASPLGLTLWDVSAEDVSRCHSALSAPSASPSLSIWWPNSSSAEPDLTGTILSADLTGRTVVLRLSRPPARLPLPPVVLAKFPLSVVDTLRYTLMHHAVANVALDVVFPLMPMPENEPDSPVAVVDECLTPVQRQVIAHVLQPDPIPTLLEGPFGAGKTRTIKETLHHLLKNPASRILICTHTNSAADIYAGAFADSQWPASMVYRLMGSMRNPGSVPANIRGYTSPSPTGSGYTRDGKLTPHYVTHPADKLASFKVVVSTTVTAGNLALLGIQPGFFTHIIIDEAAQAAEAELLIPLLLAAPGATQLVLVSDHMQMDARTNVALSLRFGFSPRLVNLTACSLPRRLSMSASLSVHRIHFFQVFRSHPHIVNALAPIYGGQICAAPGSAAALALPDMLIDEAWPRLFFVPATPDEAVAAALSLLTSAAETFPKLLESAAVITPNLAMARELRSALRSASVGSLTVLPLDNVQGLEFEVIFLLTDGKSVDRLARLVHQPRRMNTAISRARNLVVTVGHVPDILEDPAWHMYGHTCAFGADTFSRFLSMMAMRAVLPAAPGKIAALLDTLESTIDSLQIFAQDAEWSTTFFAPAKALAASLPFVQEILAVELAAVDAAKAKQSTAEPALSFAKTFKAPAELGFVPPSPTASPSPFPQLRASADSHAHAEYDAAQARSRSAAQAQAQAQAVSKVAQAAQSDAPAPAPQAKASTPTGGPPGFDAAPAPQASPSPRPAPMDTAPKQLPATVAAIIGPLITEYCGALEMEPIALVAPEAQTFTAAALDEAVTASAPTPQDELKRRLETTAARFSAPGASVPPRCFTLTEPHARDPQVALTLTGLQQDGQGNVSRVRIGVHVADLAARLRAGGELEAAILARDQTLHINLPDGSKVRRALFPSILEKTAALAADGTPKLTVSLALDIAMEPATGKWAVASSAFVETAWLIDENVTFAAAESSPLFELLFAMTDDLRAARCGGKGTTRPEYAIEYLRAAHPPQPVVRNRTASRARSALDELCITYASLAGAALKASATEDCPVLLAAEPAPSVQTMEALERTLERLGGDAADVTSAVRKLREWHTADDTPSSPGAKYAVRGAKKQSRGKKQRGKSLVWHVQTPTAADAKPPAALGALTSQTLREAVEAALGRGRTRYLAVTKSNTATPHVFHGVAAFAPVTSPLRSAAHVLAQQRLKAAVIGSSVAVTVGVKDIVQELSTKAANCGRASIKLERALFLASLQAAPLTARGMVVEILRSGAMPTGVRLFVPELAWAWPGGRGALPGIVVPLGALGSVVSTSSYARASSKSAPEVVIAQETADGKNSLALVPFTTEVCVLVGARPVGDSGKLSPALLTAWLGTKPSGPGCCVAHTTSPRAWLDANDPLDTSAGPSSSSDVGGGAVATGTVPGAEVHALKAGIVCTGMAVYTASSSAPPGLETTGRSKLFTDATVTWRNDGCGVVELPMWTVQPRPVARQLFACVRSASGSAHCAVSRIRPLPDAPETMELTLQPLADAASGVFSARLLAVAAVELFVLPAVYASQLEILEAATAVGEGAVERNSRPPALSALMSTPSPVRTPAKLRTTFKAPSFVIGDTENVPGGLLVLPSSLPEAARALVGAGEVMVVTSMHARSLASAEDVLNRAGVRYVRAAADEQLWHETSGLHRMLRLRARVNGELVPAISELVDLTAPEARSENHLDLLVYNDAKVGGALRELEASARSASREQAEKLVKEYFGLWQAAAHRILTRSVLVAPTAAFARGRLLAGLRPAVTAVAIPASVSTEAALTTELIVPAARTRNRVLVYRR